jgi:hypothetical protein
VRNYPTKPWPNFILPIMVTITPRPVPYKNTSPAKKIRSIKRLLAFYFKKSKKSRMLSSLSICHHNQSSFPPSNTTLPRQSHPISVLSMDLQPTSTTLHPQPYTDQPQADQPLPIMHRQLGDLTHGQFADIMENYMKNKCKLS